VNPANCKQPADVVPFDAMPNHYDSDAVAGLISQLCDKIEQAFPNQPALNIVGIRTRGQTIAERLAECLAARGFTDIGRGVLDITLYRDDLSEVGPKPMVRPTDIIIDINNKPLLLVDDVLFTGRSIRAALDALSDFGRPSAIRLVVLVERAGRELPIQADFSALCLSNIPPSHRVNVRLKEIDGADEIVIEPRETREPTP
jgi:pyrimidine operon attenuation protein/uracil phosphoribosyltransferase